MKRSIRDFFFSVLILEIGVFSLLVSQVSGIAVNAGIGGSLAIASHRQDYEEESSDGLAPLRQFLMVNHDNDDNDEGDDDNDNCNKDDIFLFGRFQSPHAVQKTLEDGYRRRWRRRRRPERRTASSKISSTKFTYFQGKDGRHGNVSSTKLGGDWVLAESQQLAVNCTTEEVLLAYLSGQLQKRWNQDTVLDCTITECNNNDNKNNNGSKDTILPLTSGAFWRGKQPKQQQKGQQHQQRQDEAFYQQDLVLRSQRIIRQTTGIMRYRQRIMIDKVGSDRYCVSVRLDPSSKQTSSTTTTALKPFESLSVYVHLLPENNNVQIYAAGIMKVNRKVIPNLVVFDASGIAGSMAGKGTLWLAAFFKERQLAMSQGPKGSLSPRQLSQ